jgi:hypothetical protein
MVNQRIDDRHPRSTVDRGAPDAKDDLERPCAVRSAISSSCRRVPRRDGPALKCTSIAACLATLRPLRRLEPSAHDRRRRNDRVARDSKGAAGVQRERKRG